MADFLGHFNASSSRTTVRFAFTTHAQTGAAVAPSSAFEAADLKIYKDGSATERTSANGITMTSPFDSVTGLHFVSIDLTDNTDAGFWAAGSQYTVVLTPDETVDSLAVVRVLAYFEIGPPQVNVTQFGGTAGTFASGRPEVNVSHWLGTAAATPTVAGVPEVDVTHLLGTAWLAPGTAGTPDVNVKLISSDATAADNAEAFFDGTGYAGTGNVIPTVTTVVGVTTVNGLAAGVITATSIAADAITAAKIADGAIDSATFAAGAITATVIADGAIDTATFASGTTIPRVTLADTVTTYTGNTPQTGDSYARIGAAGASLTDLGGMSTTMKGQVQTEAEDAIVMHRLDELLNADSDIDGAAPPTVGSVFHELMSATAGSFTFDQTTDSNEAIRNNMGTAQTGDAYAVVNSGTFGNSALKTLIDTVDDLLDTEVAAIYSRIGAPAGASIAADIAAVKVVDDAIKVKTDFLPSVAAGGAGGVFIAGTNAATTITTGLTTTFTGNLSGSVGSLATQAKADVNAEVLDVLNVDTFAEVGQEAPAATNTIRKMLGYLFKAFRNKSTQTATEYKLYADDATTVDHKATVSDDATTFTRQEIGTGP